MNSQHIVYFAFGYICPYSGKFCLRATKHITSCDYDDVIKKLQDQASFCWEYNRGASDMLNFKPVCATWKRD